MATTFHYFPYLPWELRARVWELSAEPRVVHVRTFEYGDILNEDLKIIISFTPIPAMLQACRESRNLGVYRRYFHELQHIPDSYYKPISTRYIIWSNLDLDMIDIGKRDLRDLKLIASTIKWLKLERDMVSHADATDLCDFDNLEEVQIVFPNERFLQRCGCFFMAFYHGHLDRKRVILVDKANDYTTTLFEWNKKAEERFEPHREEWEAAIKDHSYLSPTEKEKRLSKAHIYYAVEAYLSTQWL